MALDSICFCWVYVELARRSSSAGETGWMNVALAASMAGLSAYYGIVGFRIDRFMPGSVESQGLANNTRILGTFLFTAAMTMRTCPYPKFVSEVGGDSH